MVVFRRCRPNDSQGDAAAVQRVAGVHLDLRRPHGSDGLGKLVRRSGRDCDPIDGDYALQSAGSAAVIGVHVCEHERVDRADTVSHEGGSQ